MANEATNAAISLIDGKTIAGGGVAGGSYIIELMEWGEIVGEMLPHLVMFATFVYVCLGIRNRIQDHKNNSKH
ncbi:MAG: hypothetical protein COB84_01855 [Rhodobacteraceae bacterium]|nr:MAG: hypothetical protein COB84_01855 [Paracoccaceae bacterium]